MDVQAITDQLHDALAAEGDVVAAWLFGSTARGTARADSDVDVAILTRRPMRGTMDDLHLDVRERLAAALGREVDLVVLDAREDELVHRVLRDGTLLRDDDRSARIAFEVAARARFFDMIPIRRAYRRARETVLAERREDRGKSGPHFATAVKARSSEFPSVDGGTRSCSSGRPRPRVPHS